MRGGMRLGTIRSCLRISTRLGRRGRLSVRTTNPIQPSCLVRLGTFVFSANSTPCIDRSVERNKQSPDPLLASLVVVKERAGFKKGRGHK